MTLTTFYDLTDFGDLVGLDDFDYFTDFDDFTVVVPRKSKRGDQINYAALLLYFADLAYSDATSMSTLADRVNLAALPLSFRIPTNSDQEYSHDKKLSKLDDTVNHAS